MALVIRYRCPACGAHVDATGRASWVRCGYCQALAGVDWQTWFESPEYAAWLRAYPQNIPKFTALQHHREAAEAAVRAERLGEAQRHLREVASLHLEVTPQQFPPEVQTDAAYRERYVRYEAWARLESLVDAPLGALLKEMETVSAAMSLSDPEPTVEKVMEVMGRYYDRLFTRPGFEDPDGMPPAARHQLSLSLLVSAWLPLLSPEQRLRLLRRVHGTNNVRETGAEGSDDVGAFLEWTCPHCGLVSLQARSVTELTCVGCYHQRPLSAAMLGLEEVATRCGGCGRAVTLPAGALERHCDVCGALVRRLARTGQVEQRYQRDLRTELGSPPPTLPEEGVPGPARPGMTRQDQVLAGLGRQASWYTQIISLERYVGLVRRSLPGLTDDARAALLERVGTVPHFEGVSEDGRRRLEETRAALRRR